MADQLTVSAPNGCMIPCLHTLLLPRRGNNLEHIVSFVITVSDALWRCWRMLFGKGRESLVYSRGSDLAICMHAWTNSTPMNPSWQHRFT